MLTQPLCCGKPSCSNCRVLHAVVTATSFSFDSDLVAKVGQYSVAKRALEPAREEHSDLGYNSIRGGRTNRRIASSN
jgi:hypothetical protein